MTGALVCLFYGLVAVIGGISALVFVLGFKSGV